MPERFVQAVNSLAEDFGGALGITFQGQEGEEFFRLFTSPDGFLRSFCWLVLWEREHDPRSFQWRSLNESLGIPFLGDLFSAPSKNFGIRFGTLSGLGGEGDISRDAKHDV